MRYVRFAMAALLATTSGVVVLADGQSRHDGARLRVLTRNVYHGIDTEINAVPTATSFPDLLAKVAAVYQGYFARNFPERAAALAAEIDRTRPDLVGLQEAILVRTQSPPDGPATAATAVSLDYVQLLLNSLQKRGLRYQVVSQFVGLDVELPSALGFDVRHTDREVILARVPDRNEDFRLTNAQAGSFTINCGIPSPMLGTIFIKRGWVSVDIRKNGQRARFVSTHLDGDCLAVTTAIQRAQAAEIVAGPAVTDLPLVLVGDMNSPADGTGAAYNDFAAAGFRDAWETARSFLTGYTCCQADDLLNAASTLSQRIDLVLFRGEVEPRHARTVGDNPHERTPSQMWPSDHAGVFAKLRLFRPHRD